MADTCYARRARQLGRTVSRVFDDALRPHGLTSSQLNLLVAIELHDGVRPADLAHHLDLEKSTLSRNLSRMQEHGWIEIQSDGGREQRLSLQPAGRRLLRLAYPAWTRAQEAVRERLGDSVLAALHAL